ncbi:TetR family transcriptional regulator [Citricoccus sp.]|jgi:AcrR family transcriptional regulator|uniref:TetR family transcriptional regulator n=1 Tax=Citricoccus sp. TaxID=1978372 RepID=UPI0028BD7CD4|nr:TetR family transcriptional regulator [Citricoccus sp.]
MNDTRDRIVAAATAIVVEGLETRPSVRAVAARAGVGASTLRHHFPTQRELLETVWQKMFSDQYPDERIHDTSVPARERLLECLLNLLTPIGEGVQAREFWVQLLRSFEGIVSNSRTKSALADFSRGADARVESWLDVLDAEGAVAPGDRSRRVLFLLTVVDGLAIGRALPASGDLDHTRERGVLEDAIDAVLVPERR